MLNWKNSNHHEETPAWNFNLKMPASAQNNDINNGFKEMHEERTDDCHLNDPVKNPWNQIFMQHNIDGPKNEDYKISSSLKTIWSDVSDDRSTSSNGSDHNDDFSPKNATERRINEFTPSIFSQSVHNVTPDRLGIQSKSDMKFDHAAGAHLNISGSYLKGRAITRTSCYNNSSSGGIENGNFNQCFSSPMSGPLQHQHHQQFLQQIQIIVQNGFLDPKILNEPISTDTFDLVQMLIFYVMEYSRTRNFAIVDNNPAICDEIQNIFHKINLIQNEISKCQCQNIEQKRIEQEIMQSYSAIDGLHARKQNFVGTLSNNQHGVPMPARGSSKYSQISPNPCINVAKTETYERPNQRFRQFDQNAQPSNGNFTFLPKTKNLKIFHERNHIQSRRDGNFSTN